MTKRKKKPQSKIKNYSSAPNQNSYGKRPLWQWVILYLIIGGIIYALLYYSGIVRIGNFGHNSQNVLETQFYE